MSIIRDIFCDDDTADGKPGQVNPVKVVGFPALVSLTASVCAAAWADYHDGQLAHNALTYFGAVSTGLGGFALAVWGHSKASK